MKMNIGIYFIMVPETEPRTWPMLALLPSAPHGPQPLTSCSLSLPKAQCAQPVLRNRRPRRSEMGPCALPPLSLARLFFLHLEGGSIHRQGEWTPVPCLRDSQTGSSLLLAELYPRRRAHVGTQSAPTGQTHSPVWWSLSLGEDP